MADVIRIRKRPILPRQRPVTTSDITTIQADESDSDEEPTDLHLLKEVSQRLNLATRRPSTVQWKQVIEFRKSMGLYSSDVEPEFLDKIVGAKIMNEARNSPKIRQKSPLVNGDVKTDIKLEDELNNNIKTQSPIKTKRKSKKKEETTGNITKKNGFSFPGLKHKKSKKNSKKEKGISIENCPEVIVTDQSNVPNELNNATVPSQNSVDSNHCDVNKLEIDGDKITENINIVSRFPLYDTDDETDDTSGLSEMTIRYRNITKALGKIRRDLITMRIEDNELARKLLNARTEINLIRVQQSCDAHAEIIDDVTYELEEEDMLPGLIKACDLPSRPPGSLLSALSPLRDIGISKMNLNRRRFSIR